MKYKIKEEVKLRQEDGFYLIVNLTTEDMLSGYPSFFKTNEIGKYIIELIEDYVTIEDIIKNLKKVFPTVCDAKIETDTLSFLSELDKYSLIKKEEYNNVS